MPKWLRAARLVSEYLGIFFFGGGKEGGRLGAVWLREKKVANGMNIVVLTPVKSITRGEQVITIGDQENIGQGFQTLYEHYRGVQKGEIEDSFGWMYPAEGLA